jgi:hypothetical protein
MKCRLGLILVLPMKDSHDYYLQNVMDETSQLVYSERVLPADFFAPTHHLRYDNFSTVLITHLKVKYLRKSQFLKLHQHSSCRPSLLPERLLLHIIVLFAATERVQPPPSHKGITSVCSSSSKEIRDVTQQKQKKTGLDFVVLRHAGYVRRIEFWLLREGHDIKNRENHCLM